MIKPIRVLKKIGKVAAKAKQQKKQPIQKQNAQQQTVQQQQQMAMQQQQAQGVQQQMAPGYNNGKDPIKPIKKSKRGTFTKAANAHNSSVQGFASKVLSAPKGKYSAAMRKKANFARNAAKWHH